MYSISHPCRSQSHCSVRGGVFALSVPLASAPLHCSIRQAFLHAKILAAAVCDKKKRQSTAVTQLPALYSSPLDQQFLFQPVCLLKDQYRTGGQRQYLPRRPSSAGGDSISLLFPAKRTRAEYVTLSKRNGNTISARAPRHEDAQKSTQYTKYS